VIEVQVKCSNCRRVYRIEREYRSPVNPACGHGTIVDLSGRPNILQCGCGQYLDNQHIVRPDCHRNTKETK
jgi:uncharacterized C2H2 Zn-finger protein